MSIPTPSEIIISSTSTGVVTKRLVIRNLLVTDLFLKIVINKINSDIITLEHQRLRVAGGSVVHVEMRVKCDKVGLFNRTGHIIHGFVRSSSPSQMHDISCWLNSHDTETPRRMAFSIPVRFSNDYSAFETIIDLPGRAILMEPSFAQSGLDQGMETAVAIDADALTARNCDSIQEFMKELRDRQRGVAFKGIKKEAVVAQPRSETHHSKRAQKEEECWLMDLVFPGMKKEGSAKKQKNHKSDYVNQEMNATPCGGSAE